MILGIPISLMLLGAGIVAYFGWDMTKQTVLLAKAVVKPYEPENPNREFEQEQLWSKLPAPGEKLGDLKIASLDASWPVVQGTHEEELKQGVGHFAGSTLPGQGGHVVLSGHRDTVFRKLEHLKKGDRISFTTPYGEFVYEATDFKITHANDENIIVPTDYETLTLTTCYPFDYIGDAPDRFIVYTKLVSQPKTEKK